MGGGGGVRHRHNTFLEPVVRLLPGSLVGF
jgi:hypothetical protein